jgi:ring-1,2-phenylacetyl-CoA epoxidase subunit PaaE
MASRDYLWKMTIDFTVKTIRQETPDVKSFVLVPAPGATFRYKPGQFLAVIHPYRSDQRRSYSLSSHPAFELPTITLRRIPNGEVSRWLFDEVREGDTVKTAGASGLFTLPDNTSEYDPVAFLCAGTGITPAMSQIKELLKVRNARKVILIYSNRSRGSTVFLAEIEAIQKEHRDNFVVEYFFSTNQDLTRARLGRLALESLLDKYVAVPARALFYLCGPHVYMDNIGITLLTAGIPEQNIRREIFFNPIPLSNAEPPDRLPHKVTIRYAGKQHTLEVQYPSSILQVAKKAGLDLPFSCEAGRCGTCAATCTSGEVWMLRNEVLLDKEMAAGRVLTCTGYPVGGDVELDIGK